MRLFQNHFQNIGHRHVHSHIRTYVHDHVLYACSIHHRKARHNVTQSHYEYITICHVLRYVFHVYICTHMYVIMNVIHM